MPPTRRAALATLGGALGVATAGCVAGGRGASESGERSRTSGGDAVSLLAAGSLARALDERLRPAVDARLSLETRGSAACAALVRDGLRDPDVLALADPALFAGLARRYTAFATNALVVAYDPDSAGGRAVRDADRAFDPLLDRDLRLGRTDPDADPLGYRTLFALRLAAARWDRPYPDALDPGQLFPETQLLRTFETGALDAAVVYRNMAVDHDVPFRELPPAVDLSSPAHAEAYARETYTLPDGQVVRGAAISYGAALRRPSPAARGVFDALVGAGWTEGALSVPESYPRVEATGSE